MTEWLHFDFSLSRIGEGNGNPLQCSCLENPRDGAAWRAAIYGVAQSQTWLKRLSSSSNSSKALLEALAFSSAWNAVPSDLRPCSPLPSFSLSFNFLILSSLPTGFFLYKILSDWPSPLRLFSASHLLFNTLCCALSLSCVRLFSSHGLSPAKLLCPWWFSRQEYWIELLCSPPADLPNPGIKPRSSALQVDS